MKHFITSKLYLCQNAYFQKKEAICLNHNLEKVQKYTLENMVDIGSHLVETF